MRPSTSFFLDLLRVLAAAVVFGVHCIYFWHPGLFGPASHWAHAAVVVFFVLSGYVIAYAASHRERDLRAYTVARLSRLYSVLIPALVLTALVQVVGHACRPDFPQFQSRGYELVRYLVVAASLQSVWTVFASPLANAPFWSLSYEFWYYALFGAATLLPRGRWRVLGVVAVLAVAGTNILLLLPCWLAGVFCYAWRDRLPGGAPAARLGLFVSLAAVVLVLAFVPELPQALGQPPWWFSSTFVSDFLLAVAVAGTIFCFDAAHLAAPAGWSWQAVRWGANHTFSLYLYHFPLLAFVTAVWRLHQPPGWQMALAVSGTLASVLLLSTLTEAKRPVWRQWFARGWDVLARRQRV